VENPTTKVVEKNTIKDTEVKVKPEDAVEDAVEDVVEVVEEEVLKEMVQKSTKVPVFLHLLKQKTTITN